MLGIIIDSISTFMYSKLLVILLIGAGIYFTIRTKLPQMRLFKDACKAVFILPKKQWNYISKNTFPSQYLFLI